MTTELKGKIIGVGLGVLLVVAALILSAITRKPIFNG